LWWSFVMFSLPNKAALSGLMGIAILAGRAEFTFAHENVIGTSFDLRLVTTDHATATAARDAALAEVERLEAILSTYLPSAELARFNRGAPLIPSPELVELLTLYDAWGRATGGAISAALLMDPRAGKGWEIDHLGVMRVNKILNVDALGKAYVTQKAAEAAKKIAGVTGGVLDIGGDLVSWGTDADGKAWRVLVADPHNPAENAAKIAAIDVNDACIATSGSYARGRHIIDPRTGAAQREIVSTTVVADDLVSANALATAMNVGTMRDAKTLMKKFPRQDAIAVNARGDIARQGDFVLIAAEAAPAANWPAGFQVTVPIDINMGGRRERPFVVVWIEDDKGAVVRAIEIWGGLGKDAKYLRDLRTFWKIAQKDPEMVKNVTRASRAPGVYSMVWDGTDQKGNAVPAGTYTVWLEVGSEHGGRAAGSAKIVCGNDKATAALKGTNAFNAGNISYGPKPEKSK
jgi:thiamine biosynthesis lipoprotein ApbE